MQFPDHVPPEVSALNFRTTSRPFTNISPTTLPLGLSPIASGLRLCADVLTVAEVKLTPSRAFSRSTCNTPKVMSESPVFNAVKAAFKSVIFSSFAKNLRKTGSTVPVFGRFAKGSHTSISAIFVYKKSRRK